MPNPLLNSMAALSEEAARELLWKPFADYCRSRSRNDRELAAVAAQQFAGTAVHWPFDERMRFSLWLMDRTGWALEQCGQSKFVTRYPSGGRGLSIATPVFDFVVRPTLLEWRKNDPMKAEPHFWLGLYDDNPWQDLKEAMRLDSTHGPTRAALVELALAYVCYCQHELPSGYIDEPTDSFSELDEAEGWLTETVDANVSHSLREQILALRVTAAEWIRLRGKINGKEGDTRKAIWATRHQSEASVRNS